ncbi:MAG: hypothetical protein IKI28_10800 [Bacteroidales bacterium]|nr:hypothetical protein [Bacteroidales bacterium]
MSTFTGSYDCKADEKGRILFPASLKRRIATAAPDRFVVKKDIYVDCLVLYTMEEWEHLNSIIRARTNPYNREHNAFVREFYRDTAEVNLDGNGRLLLPRRLLDLVGIAKDVVMAGAGDRMEIWAAVRYNSSRLDADQYAALAEKYLGSEPLTPREE